jgi:hypothetical protein
MTTASKVISMGVPPWAILAWLAVNGGSRPPANPIGGVA